MLSSTPSPPGPASMLSLSSNKSSRELLFPVSQTVKHRQKTHKPRTANSTRTLHHISLFIVALSHIVGCRKMKNMTFTQISRKKLIGHWPLINTFGPRKKYIQPIRPIEWSSSVSERQQKPCREQQFRDFFWLICWVIHEIETFAAIILESWWPKHFKTWWWIPQQGIFGQDLFHPNCFREVVENKRTVSVRWSPPPPLTVSFSWFFFGVRLTLKHDYIFFWNEFFT